MEVIRGWTHAAFPIDDASRIGEARRHASSISTDLKWGEVEAGRLALVITELGTNLLRHAKHGRLLIAARLAFDDIEVISIDEGPGMASLDRSMADGYSTGGGSPGTGLGAIRRLSSTFEVHSAVPAGTVCVARIARTKDNSGQVPAQGPYHFAYGAICLPIRGESVCGDGWGVALDGSRATAIVADGLGHGPHAAAASQAALDIFIESAHGDLRHFVEQAHSRLQVTRGAALCVLRIDGEAQTVQSAGAGNVAVRVVSGVFDRSMITQHGTVGIQIRKPDQSVLDMPQHGVVIVHSDGLMARWDTAPIQAVLERDPILAAAILFRDFSRGRDDATVVVIRQEERA